MKLVSEVLKSSIAFLGGDDLGILSLTWLSPEWIETVKMVLKGADEWDMIRDIIVGSGWPFGTFSLKWNKLNSHAKNKRTGNRNIESCRSVEGHG